jgi:threonine/homoserine/homoserine lactone efflux protein
LSGTTPALIAAAAGVGFGHAVLPDHWVPLAVVGRTHRYPLSRVARLSGLAGVAHVIVSVLLGAAIVAVGLQFRSTIESAQNTIVGALLVATGLAFVAVELSGHGHSHSHPHAHGPGHPHSRARPGRLRGSLEIMVPFGAAASPDLTILPVFLAAAAVGTGTAVGSLLAFAVVTITTIVGLTLLATLGGYQLRGRWLDRWGNAITAVVLVLVGALVLAGTI